MGEFISIVIVIIANPVTVLVFIGMGFHNGHQIVRSVSLIAVLVMIIDLNLATGWS
jgi:hypothetical protein